jgi:hypothetical protein
MASSVLLSFHCRLSSEQSMKSFTATALVIVAISLLAHQAAGISCVSGSIYHRQNGTGAAVSADPMQYSSLAFATNANNQYCANFTTSCNTTLDAYCTVFNATRVTFYTGFAQASSCTTINSTYNGTCTTIPNGNGPAG